MDARVNEFYATIKSTGFEWADELVHLFIGGSEAHGAKVGKSDDLDLYGIYIPPPSQALGVTEYEKLENGQERAKQPEHFVWSTAGDNRRNGPDDIDLILYSLRKWAGMAVSGNPTALHFLFTPNLSLSPHVWEMLRLDRGAFLCSTIRCITPALNAWRTISRQCACFQGAFVAFGDRTRTKNPGNRCTKCT